MHEGEHCDTYPIPVDILLEKEGKSNYVAMGKQGANRDQGNPAISSWAPVPKHTNLTRSPL